MNIAKIMEQSLEQQNQFSFAGNSLSNLSQSSDLKTRQAVADQYNSPQIDFGSLLAILEQS